MNKLLKLSPALSLMIVLAGCSQTPPPQQNLATQASPSPSPTAELVAEASPVPETPVATVGGTGSRPAARSGGSNSRPATGSGGNTGGGYGSAPAPAAPPRVTTRTYTIAAGTSISVSTEEEISTKRNKVGDTFEASLNDELVDNGVVVARRGANVTGVVTEADQGGRVKGKASISVALRSIQLADGRTVNISSSQFYKEAKASKKKDAAKIGIGAGIGAAIGAIAGGGKGAAIGAGIGGGAGTGAVLATKGDPAVIPAESNLNVTLSSPISITKRQ